MHCKKKVVEKLTLKTFSFPLAIIGLIQQVEIIFEERSYYFRPRSLLKPIFELTPSSKQSAQFYSLVHALFQTVPGAYVASGQAIDRPVFSRTEGTAGHGWHNALVLAHPVLGHTT